MSEEPSACRFAFGTRPLRGSVDLRCAVFAMICVDTNSCAASCVCGDTPEYVHIVEDNFNCQDAFNKCVAFMKIVSSQGSGKRVSL